MKKIILLIVIPFFTHLNASNYLDNGFKISSPAFSNKGSYPKLYTCDSLGISPPIAWENAPNGTKCFAITMHHFPKEGDKHVYMVLYNIPESFTTLPQGEKNLGLWGSNTQNHHLGYSPPCSKGPGPKTYIITVYALSEKLVVNHQDGLKMDELLTENKNSILAQSSMEVVYAR